MPIRSASALAALAFLAAAGGWAAPADAAPKDPAAIQKERSATMKSINKKMRALKVLATKGDLAEVVREAGAVAGLTARIPELSPKGSAVGKTRIKPEVWKNFDDYKSLAARSAEAARGLAAAAKGGDRAAVRASFSKLAKTCGACHKPYREKKKEGAK